MKKFGLSLLLVIGILASGASAFASVPGEFGFSMDAMALDSFFTSGSRVSAECSWRYEQIRVALPVTYAFDLETDLSILDIAIRLDCYPVPGWGLFFGVDVFRYGRFFGRSSPDDRDLFISSISAGWTFSFPHFFVEPRLVILDPAGVISSERELLADSFWMYLPYYGAIIIGVTF